MKTILNNFDITNISRWLLRVNRYPRYVVDFYCNIVMKFRLKRIRCRLGDNIWFNGLPIITTVADSEIIIGDDVLLCSRSVNTALGCNHPIIMRAMKTNAIITIGNGVRMSGTSICAGSSIRIGDNVVIGANVVIADTDFHSMDFEQRRTRKVTEDLESSGCSPIIIESDVFIGANSTILKGVHVGKGATIGFGSVVTKNVPPFSIIAGNPAIIIGDVRNRYPKETLKNK